MDYRYLIYDINSQRIEQNKNCDFDYIIKGTKGYLCTKFNFSDDWKGLAKVLQVSNQYDFEKNAVSPIINNECMLPDEVTDENVIYLRVFGQKGNKRMVTNTIRLRQEG